MGAWKAFSLTFKTRHREQSHNICIERETETDGKDTDILTETFHLGCVFSV